MNTFSLFCLDHPIRLVLTISSHGHKLNHKKIDTSYDLMIGTRRISIVLLSKASP
ncbi:hypothetical protein SLEP1_g37746 [Rubroshorea leprosula]|uniref:Uncharacterized protein n=1 Tax=Rubroshorea leprosula TaxID=152421 RepID=A0AAV5KW80_9ROSI|nr:hypothetical protein SLEP1_g37746 [Rubroshorea leprosula]